MKENKFLEFKQDYTNSFLKTVSAFSNYGNGEIVFGVNDNGTKVGIENTKDFCMRIENKINESIVPNPNYSINVVDGIVSLQVNEGMHKPYYYNSKAYKRNDTATIEVDKIELNRLILDGENRNFEQLKSKNKNLTFNYLSKEFKEVKNIMVFNLDTLKTLDLYDDYNGYNNAADILSDNNSFPYIDIARFGENINIIRHRIDYKGKSILEQYNLSVDLFKTNYVYEKIEDIRRKEVETIPLNAFREALANAIIHRTWDDYGNIQVSFFEDRVEIVSPGGFIHGMNKDKYLYGMISLLRNPILGNVFYRLNYIEKFGTGIKRILTAYENSKTKPEFIIFDDLVKVILPVYKEYLEMSLDEEAVYNYISNTHVSSSELVKSLSFSKSKIVNILNKLVENNYIKTAGEGRLKKYFK